MTDMRDFAPSNEIRTESAFIDTGVPEVKEIYVLDDSGGLGEFHRPIVEGESSNRGSILGALAVALMLGAAGVGAYSIYGTNSDAPMDQTATVVEKAPPVVTPDAAMTDTAAPDASAMAPAPEAMTPAPAMPQQRRAAAPAPRVMIAPAPQVAMTPAPAPVTAAPATITPPAVTPVENQASAIPEAVSPTPPASAVAGTPANQQSATPEPEPVTPVETAPVPEAAAPAPVDQSQ